MNFVISLINTAVSVLILLIFVNSLLSFFLAPYHPIRRTLGLVVEPLLAPIRKIVPPIGGLDLSPLIFIILLQVLGSLLNAILRSLT